MKTLLHRFWEDEAGATAALRRFESSQPATRADANGAAGAPASPFVRVGLLRQSAGVVPLLPPAAYVKAFARLADGDFDQAIAEFRTAAARAGASLQDDDLRDGAFATLRRESPITFFDVPEVAGFAPGAGHWALTTFEDVHHASRHPEIFSSVPTSTALNDVPAEIAEFAGSMISLDDPRHLRLRKIVNRAFTPKVVARIEDSVRERARRLVRSARRSETSSSITNTVVIAALHRGRWSSRWASGAAARATRAR